ncbi:MAG: amidohydrolase/deacetylase family metallohydrolase [Candidatus Tectomicrobia bacterium]|uniref:Amidohydrolase/deacetylase family metallohydrolase n=1 Tax=Tectimicrobiota bacterium TaxID=2528274 RepID=A0A932MLU8_UNCTE|nr:amidohydrolase/deacetylase family metallohydrolase [Candidatus Tectomicrobia bacterium]
MTGDLLIRGGYLTDPSQGIEGTMDVEIRRGRVRRIAPHIELRGMPTLDARGKLVTPGLVDLHCHFFEGISHYGVSLEKGMLARGVTTAVDTGSAGAQTFPSFRRWILDAARPTVRAFLNISAGGLLLPGIGENIDMRALGVERALECYKAHRDLLVGMKVRLSRNVVGRSGGRPLDPALEAAKALRVPLMVHVGDTPESLPKILRRLRPGDVLTHAFHGRRESILDRRGKVRRAVWEARDRGILLDVAHGQASFRFETLETAMAQGLMPGNLSTDLHAHCINGPVWSFPNLIGKFLALGFPLAEVIRLSTQTTARWLGLEREIGTLRPGARGDAAVFRVKEGRFTFVDCHGGRRRGKQMLETMHVVLGGVVLKAAGQEKRALVPR